MKMLLLNFPKFKSEFNLDLKLNYFRTFHNIFLLFLSACVILYFIDDDAKWVEGLNELVKFMSFDLITGLGLAEDKILWKEYERGRIDRW